MEVLQGHPRSGPFSSIGDSRDRARNQIVNQLRRSTIHRDRVSRWLKLGAAGSPRAQFGHSSVARGRPKRHLTDDGLHRLIWLSRNARLRLRWSCKSRSATKSWRLRRPPRRTKSASRTGRLNVWHPDRFVGNEPLRMGAQQKLARINEAFGVLEAAGLRRIISVDLVSARLQDGPEAVRVCRLIVGIRSRNLKDRHGVDRCGYQRFARQSWRT
jgi:hypothetical protein